MAAQSTLVGSKHRRALVTLSIWVACCLEIVLRRPDMVANPQPWAEDGHIFIEELLFGGFWPTLFKPYAGYLHLVPRVGTFLAVRFSEAAGLGLQLAPTFMNAMAISIAAGSVGWLCAARFDWLAPLPYRVAVAILILAVPGPYELFCPLTNAHWWLSVPQLLATWDLWETKRLPSRWAMVTLFIASFSGPLSLLPAAGFGLFFLRQRLWRTSSDARWSLTAAAVAVGIGSSFELLVSAATRAPRARPPMLDVPLEAAKAFLAVIAARLVVPEVGPHLQQWGFTIMAAVGLVLLGTLGWLARPRMKSAAVPAAFVSGYMLLLLAGASDWLAQMTNPYMDNGARYVFLPCAAILVILCRGIGHAWVTRRSTQWGVGVAVLAAVAYAERPSFRLPDYVDFHWREATQPYVRAGQSEALLPINPNWGMRVPTR